MHRFSRLALLLGAIIMTPFAHPAIAQSASGLDLDLYARLLDQHTRETSDLVGVRVDYKTLGGVADWKQLVGQVKAVKPSQLSATERKAYWINAYNILTIDLILANPSVESIKDIGSFFSPVWDKPVATIEGKARSLGEIEHKILRPLGDPRIHAGIVCASISCPPLARTPFRPESLDADLDRAMRTWLASDGKGVRINRAANAIQVSKIFSWFEEDFAQTGGIPATIAQFVSEEDTQWLRAQGDRVRISYFGYDWSLNALR